MPTIAHCPKCDQQVSLPQGVDPSARVRCPLCEEEYVLEDALAKAPPELILLDPPEGATAAVGAAESAAAAESDDPWLEDWSSTATESIKREDDEVEEPTEVEEPEDSLADEREQGAVTEELDFDRDLGSDAADDFEFGGVPVDTAGTVDFDSGSSSSAADIPSAPVMTRRKPPSSSPLRQLIGIFGGGVVGLALGYIILLWIGGPTKDFLKIGKKLPPFMVPSSFHASSTASDSDFDLEDKDIGAEWDKKIRAQQNEPQSSTPSSRPGQLASNSSPATTERPETNTGLLDGPTVAATPEPTTIEPPKAEPLKIDPLKIDPPISSTPAASEKPEEPEPIPVRGVQPTTAEQLAQALKAAADAREALTGGSIDALQDEEQQPLILDAFKKFCRLADVVTFVRGKPDEDQLGSRRRAVGDLARELIKSEGATELVGYVCDGWIHTENRDANGVVLVATVIATEAAGECFATRVTPYGRTREVVVVTDTEPKWEVDATVVVFGSIVDDPATNLTGYEGEDERVIWSGVALAAE